MKNTVDYDSRKIIKNEAGCYLLDSEGFAAAPKKDYSFLVGAGSIFSTAQDVYKFGMAGIDGKYGNIAKQKSCPERSFLGVMVVPTGFGQTFGLIPIKNMVMFWFQNLGSGANDLILNHLRKVLEGGETIAAKVPSPKN